MRMLQGVLVGLCVIGYASVAGAQVLQQQTATATAAAAAPPAQSSTPKEQPSTYDRIWTDFTQWYKNDKNTVIQQVLFTGRFQYDLAAVSADQGDHDEANIRRVRFGPRVTFLRQYLGHVEVEVNPQERDPFYVRLTDAYVQWNKSPKFAVTVGKQAAPFTNEGATSSKELLTIDRSIIGQDIWFPQEYMPGVSVSGKIAPWNYRFGVYSSGAMNREFGEFNGGGFLLAVVGYDFAKKLGMKEALVTGNYVYQDPNVNNTFTRPNQQVASVWTRFEADNWGVRTDLDVSQGYLGQSDMWGWMVMPFYNFTNRLQGVTRITHLSSADPNGLRPTGYEARVVPGRGDEFNEFYIGANYYFYGQKLKVQTGVQLDDMKDRANDGGAYSGVSWTTGLRVGW